MSDADQNILIEHKRGRQGFTQIRNELFDYNEISPEARFLLFLLLRHDPVKWKYSRTDMIRRCGVGEKKYRRMVKELKDQGFLEIKRVNDPKKGGFVGCKWITDDLIPTERPEHIVRKVPCAKQADIIRPIDNNTNLKEDQLYIISQEENNNLNNNQTLNDNNEDTQLSTSKPITNTDLLGDIPEKKKSSAKKRKAAPRVPIPDNFPGDDLLIEASKFFRGHGLSKDVDVMADNFKFYWKETAIPSKRNKADWPATWRQWYRNEASRAADYEKRFNKISK